MYPIPIETQSSLPLVNQLDDLMEFQDFLEEQGISCKNSRIDRYVQYYTHLVKNDKGMEEEIFKNSVDGPFKNSSNWAAYIIREVHELVWILKGLKQCRPKGLRAKLKCIVSGRDFAALDKKSMSRDVQFELRIASYFCQAGYGIDLSTDTDIIIENSTSVYYVECKRVSSRRKLVRNMNNARKQLRLRMPKKRNGKPCYGIVALDVTKAAFVHNGLTFGVTPEHSRDYIRQALIELSDLIDGYSFFRRSKRVLEVSLNIHISTVVIVPSSIGTRFSFLGLHNPFLKRKQRKALKMIVEARKISIQPDPRESPPVKLVPRKELVLPKGTKWNFDKELLVNYLRSNDLESLEKSAIVFEVLFNETECKFSLLELEIVLGASQAEERVYISNNIEKEHAKLMTKLMLLRFPYEDGSYQ